MIDLITCGILSRFVNNRIPSREKLAQRGILNSVSIGCAAMFWKDKTTNTCLLNNVIYFGRCGKESSNG